MPKKCMVLLIIESRLINRQFDILRRNGSWPGKFETKASCHFAPVSDAAQHENFGPATGSLTLKPAWFSDQNLDTVLLLGALIGFEQDISDNIEMLADWSLQQTADFLNPPF